MLQHTCYLYVQFPKRFDIRVYHQANKRLNDIKQVSLIIFITICFIFFGSAARLVEASLAK